MSNVKTFIGYKPYPHQAVVHQGLTKYGKNSGHIHIVKSRRQVGKSFIILNELLRFSINNEYTTSCCLSPTLNQARKIYKEILKVTDQTGIIRKKNDSFLEIELINDSIIVFKSAEQRESLRGYTFDFLCIDEAAYISDEVWAIIRPTTDVKQAPILITSTPKFRLGFFFDLFQMGYLEKYKDKITSYDLCKFDTSSLLSNDMVEMYKQMLPKNMFICEILGEFLDTESVVFGDFKQCIGEELKEYKELYIGVDWGSGVGSDNTVVTALNEHNELVFQLAFNNKQTLQQIDYIIQYIDGFGDKVKHILAECNGLGKPLCDNLKAKMNKKIPFTEWSTTNQNKIELINKLQVSFEQRKIQIPNDEALIAELSMFEAKVNAKGTVQYSAPVGANDDRVMSLLFALKAKEMRNKKGNYSISFV